MSDYGLFSEGRQIARPRKPYRRPELEALGDLRTMTLGTSPTGIKDSGTGTLYEFVGDLLPPPGFLSPPDAPSMP